MSERPDLQPWTVASFPASEEAWPYAAAPYVGGIKPTKVRRVFSKAEVAALFFCGTTVGLILARFDFLDRLMAVVS